MTHLALAQLDFWSLLLIAASVGSVIFGAILLGIVIGWMARKGKGG